MKKALVSLMIVAMLTAFSAVAFADPSPTPGGDQIKTVTFKM